MSLLLLLTVILWKEKLNSRKHTVVCFSFCYHLCLQTRGVCCRCFLLVCELLVYTSTLRIVPECKNTLGIGWFRFRTRPPPDKNLVSVPSRNSNLLECCTKEFKGHRLGHPRSKPNSFIH